MLFTTRLNESRTSVQNGDMLTEEGLPLNALYSYRDATLIMPLSTEGFTKALSVLLQIYPASDKQETKKAMLSEIKEYISVLESRKDKDSEVYLTLGKSHALLGGKEKADKYFSLALDFYPSSAYYAHEIARFYANKKDFHAAMRVVRSFDPFIEKHRGQHNPRGNLVYLIRDIEAEINYEQGNKVEALKIAKMNADDAKNSVFVTSSAKSRHFTTKDSLIDGLKRKVEKYEKSSSGHVMVKTQ